MLETNIVSLYYSTLDCDFWGEEIHFGGVGLGFRLCLKGNGVLERKSSAPGDDVFGKVGHHSVPRFCFFIGNTKKFRSSFLVVGPEALVISANLFSSLCLW